MLLRNLIKKPRVWKQPFTSRLELRGVNLNPRGRQLVAQHTLSFDKQPVCCFLRCCSWSYRRAAGRHSARNEHT